MRTATIAVRYGTGKTKVAYRRGVWAVTEHLPLMGVSRDLWCVTHLPTGRSAIQAVGLTEAREFCRLMFTRWPKWRANAGQGDAPTPPKDMAAARAKWLAARLQK